MAGSAIQQAMPGRAALTMADELNFANMAASGNLVPQQYQGNPANILIAVNLGAAMGLGPAESLYRINVIKGKPTASAELIAAQVRKAGHKLRISKDEAAQSVTATIVRADDPDYPVSETRDIAWARRMGLANNPNYQRQPMTMLTWRAITAAAREACPEALYGVAYTPDEMHDMDGARPDERPAQDVEVGAEPSPSPGGGAAAIDAQVRRLAALGYAEDEVRAWLEAQLSQGGADAMLDAADALAARADADGRADGQADGGDDGEVGF